MGASDLLEGNWGTNHLKNETYGKERGKRVGGFINSETRDEKNEKERLRRVAGMSRTFAI